MAKISPHTLINNTLAGDLINEVAEIIANTLQLLASGKHDDDAALSKAELIDQLTLKHAVSLAQELSVSPSLVCAPLRPVVEKIVELGLAAAPAAADRLLARVAPPK